MFAARLTQAFFQALQIRSCLYASVESAVRGWVKKAEEEALDGGNAEALTTTEKEELQRLRRENKTLKMEREILKKAAAFFAKESQ